MKFYYALNKSFLRMRDFTEKTRVNVYKTLTYGCESWVLTKESKAESRLQK